MFLRVANLSVAYEKRQVIDNISFDVNKGEALLLTGRNGSGKTTILKILSGLIPWVYPARVSGEVSIAGISPIKNPGQMHRLARYLPPNPDHYILAPTPYDDIALSLSLMNISDIESKMKPIIEMFKLDDILEESVLDLSSGQLQKTALAGIIASGIDCLLLDEPMSHLDSLERKNLLSILMEIKESGKCLVIATHYPEYYNGLVDEVINLGSSTSESCKSLETTGFEPEKGNIVLRAEKLRYSYPSGKEVIKEADLELYNKEAVIISGRNGSGKTTFLKILAGIFKPSHGRIEYHERPAYLPSNPLKVFTSPKLKLELEAGGNDLEMVEWLDESLLNKPLKNLSTGELKKAALTVLFVSGAKTIVMDEPELGLDPEAKCVLVDTIWAMKSKGYSFVIATHDSMFADMVGDRFYRISDGRVEEI